MGEKLLFSMLTLFILQLPNPVPNYLSLPSSPHFLFRQDPPFFFTFILFFFYFYTSFSFFMFLSTYTVFPSNAALIDAFTFSIRGFSALAPNVIYSYYIKHVSSAHFFTAKSVTTDSLDEFDFDTVNHSFKLQTATMQKYSQI